MSATTIVQTAGNVPNHRVARSFAVHHGRHQACNVYGPDPDRDFGDGRCQRWHRLHDLELMQVLTVGTMYVELLVIGILGSYSLWHSMKLSVFLLPGRPEPDRPRRSKPVLMKRPARPAELAATYVMPAEPVSSFVSATTVAVTGGNPFI
jgi:hypothetical protein